MLLGAWLISLFILCCFIFVFFFLYVFFGCFAVSWVHFCPDSLLTGFLFAWLFVQLLLRQVTDTHQETHQSFLAWWEHSSTHESPQLFFIILLAFTFCSIALFPGFLHSHPSYWYSHSSLPRNTHGSAPRLPFFLNQPVQIRSNSTKVTV